MNFEKITIFADSIEKESKVLQTLGFEVSEANRAYNKHNINDVVFSINHRQKGNQTNYEFYFDIDEISKEKLKKSFSENDIEFVEKDTTLISNTSEYKYIFNLKHNLSDNHTNGLINYNLTKVFLQTTVTAEVEKQIIELFAAKKEEDKLTILSDEFNIEIDLSQNNEISTNTPISLLFSYEDKRYSVICSGKAVVLTEIK